ncbi:MAG TPA: chloride channel protein [Gemmataceae bacterium]|nr:chloride channel protein [Gemmataceae bacterium]
MSEMPAPSQPLRWFPEFLELTRKRLQPQVRVMGLSLVVGVIAGLGAVVFFAACQVIFHYTLYNAAGYDPNHPANEPPLLPEVLGAHPFIPWLLLIIPTVGGILSGFLVYTFAPEAEGHGTDAAIAAYHYHQGRIRPLVPVVKIVASALTLGTGGSGGREGPIAQIGAGFGSFLGGVLRLRANERRILMAAGMGAGVGAIFRAPLAGALFAAEVLYSSPDFESDVIIPAGLATVIAYSIFGLTFGWKPLFALPANADTALTFNNPLQLVPYAVLALFLVVLAMLYTRTFYGLTHLFHRVPMRPHFKPAVGAFLTGLLGLVLWFALGEKQVLAVLSFGYGVLQDALSAPSTGPTALYLGLVLLAVAFGKILTTGLTIGSGGSGGVFGPSMVIGGCGGGALGIFWYALFHPLMPQLAPHPANFVIIGMAGFFAAAAKTPFSTLVIVSEMTGSYDLLLPTLWVCALAFLLSDEQSIYSSQLTSRSLSPAHQGDYVRRVLANLFVSQFITPGQEVPLLHPGDRLPEVLDRLSSTTYHALPVIDEQGKLLGVVSLEEVHLASQSPNLGPLLVAADLMRKVTPLRPEERLDQALEAFVENDVLALPVVDNTAEGRVVGIVKQSDVASTYLRHVHGVAEEASSTKLNKVQ